MRSDPDFISDKKVNEINTDLNLHKVQLDAEFITDKKANRDFIYQELRSKMDIFNTYAKKLFNKKYI